MFSSEAASRPSKSLAGCTNARSVDMCASLKRTFGAPSLRWRKDGHAVPSYTPKAILEEEFDAGKPTGRPEAQRASSLPAARGPDLALHRGGGRRRLGVPGLDVLHVHGPSRTGVGPMTASAIPLAPRPPDGPHRRPGGVRGARLQPRRPRPGGGVAGL